MKKKLFTKLILSVATAVACVSPFTLNGVTNLAKVKAEVTTEKVGEIWNDDTKKFDGDNLLKLFKQMTGNDDFEMADFPMIYNLAGVKAASNEFRKSSVSTKQAGDDIVVTVGGLDWTPVYLSKDNDDNPMLTLLLVSPLEGTAEGQSLQSKWATFFAQSDVHQTYPVAMYGTSYLRTVVLNNGGEYLATKDAEELVAVEAKADHQLAAFTYDSKGESEEDIVDLRDFLIQPRNVAWQEDGQSSKALGYISFKSSNENWKKDQPDTDFANKDASGNEFDKYFNYSDRENYDAWADDYVWLPSISETGFFRQGTEHEGMWKLSENQRRFDDGNAANSYWLRTGLWNSSTSSLLMKNDGQEYTFANASNDHGVRPAIHLNLNAAALSTTTSGEKIGFEASYNFIEGAQFTKEGLVIYDVYDNGLKIAVKGDFTCDVEEGTVLHEGDEINLRIGDETYTYIVPKTKIENGKFEATSTQGFGGGIAVSLDIEDVSDATQIEEYLTTNGFALNNVTNIYTVKLLQGTDIKVPLRDYSAVIKALASNFGTNCKFYTVEDEQLVKLTVDNEGYVTHEGTEFTLLVQAVSTSGGEGQPVTDGDNKDLIIGLSCGLGGVLLVACGVVVFILLRRRKNNKEQ